MNSTYYPPRARWYHRLLVPWHIVQRELRLDRIHLPAGYSPGQSLLSLIVPGYAMFVSRRCVLGWTFLCTYLISAILFVVALGYQVGSVCYGLMISVHASSIIFLEGQWLRRDCRFGLRLIVATVTLVAVWLGAYAPVLNYIDEHWITTVRSPDRVMIVRRTAVPTSVQHGEFLLFSIGGIQAGDAHRMGGAFRLQTGFGWGPVLAREGERVEFAEHAFAVNGISTPSLPHMPKSGGFIVPENHWFIWPELAIRGRSDAAEPILADLMVQAAVVSKAQFVGKPFRHWFGRRQF